MFTPFSFFQAGMIGSNFHCKLQNIEQNFMYLLNASFEREWDVYSAIQYSLMFMIGVIYTPFCLKTDLGKPVYSRIVFSKIYGKYTL